LVSFFFLLSLPISYVVSLYIYFGDQLVSTPILQVSPPDQLVSMPILHVSDPDTLRAGFPSLSQCLHRFPSSRKSRKRLCIICPILGVSTPILFRWGNPPVKYQPRYKLHRPPILQVSTPILQVSPPDQLVSTPILHGRSCPPVKYQPRYLKYQCRYITGGFSLPYCILFISLRHLSLR